MEWRLRVVHHHVDILLLHGLLVMLQLTLLYLVWWDHPHLSLLLFLHLPLPLLLLAPLQLKSTEALLPLPVSTLLRHVHHTLFRVQLAAWTQLTNIIAQPGPLNGVQVRWPRHGITREANSFGVIGFGDVA